MKFIKKLFKKHKKEKPKSFLITAGNGGNAGCDELGKNGESIMKDDKGGDLKVRMVGSRGGASGGHPVVNQGDCYIGGGSVHVRFVSSGSGNHPVVNHCYNVVNHCYNCDMLEEELKKSKQELESIKNLYINN